MNLPGIEIRPIREMTGGSTFNEVFFTDVRLPAVNLVGEQDEGWRLAKVTLGNERVSLSTGGVLWGSGPTALEMLDAVRARGVVADPIMRQRLAGIYTEHVLLDLIRMRTLSARLRGEQPGPEASIRKILADEHGQHVMEVARDLLGANGMLRSTGEKSERGQHTGLGGGGGVGMRALDHPGWFDGYMFARSLTIGGGTGEVQRNIVAERALGLPHDADVLSGMTWSQTQKQNTKI
jgi:alkylation response protein AidB-like acyl-CoA dehydrogenase